MKDTLSHNGILISVFLISAKERKTVNKCVHYHIHSPLMSLVFLCGIFVNSYDIGWILSDGVRNR